MSNDKPALLPCPFCGSAAEFGEHSAYSTDSSFDCIRCTNNACGALMYEHHAPSWNRRRAMPLQDHAPQLPRLERNQTGSALVFEGGSLTVSKNGTAKFVYDENDAELDVEEGKTILIHHINNTELIWLRDKLNDLFPVTQDGGKS